MRVNVYGEELTDRIEVVEKVVEDTDEVEHTFYGVRFWLAFPNQPWWVHRKISSEPGEVDDDSSALTIWSDSKEKLKEQLEMAANLLN